MVQQRRGERMRKEEREKMTTRHWRDRQNECLGMEEARSNPSNEMKQKMKGERED